MKIKDIEHNGIRYASVYNTNEINDGLSFLTDDSSFIQVGTWKYEKGKILDAHYHNTFDRSSTQTQEIVYVISGEIICNIYTKDGVFISSFNLSSGMFAVQLYGVHEYEIVENAKVLEVKNGPYFGPEKDSDSSPRFHSRNGSVALPERLNPPPPEPPLQSAVTQQSKESRTEAGAE